MKLYMISTLTLLLVFLDTVFSVSTIYFFMYWPFYMDWPFYIYWLF